MCKELRRREPPLPWGHSRWCRVWRKAASFQCSFLRHSSWQKFLERGWLGWFSFLHLGYWSCYSCFLCWCCCLILPYCTSRLQLSYSHTHLQSSLSLLLTLFPRPLFLFLHSLTPLQQLQLHCRKLWDFIIPPWMVYDLVNFQSLLWVWASHLLE